jgi:hypothetical protein
LRRKLTPVKEEKEGANAEAENSGKATNLSNEPLKSNIEEDGEDVTPVKRKR